MLRQPAVFYPLSFDPPFALRASILASFAGVALCWLLLAGRHKERAARAWWTFGWLCYLAHVCVAFHFYHGWSHARAALHTGERTFELTGWYWTGGLWINYLFTLLWTVDVLYWWTSRRPYRARPATIRWFIHSCFAFMIFQAGVVFAAGATRWITAIGLIAVGTYTLFRIRQTR